MSKLYFRYGAMNCGKTTALLQVAYNYEEKGMKVLIIKSEIDKKGGDHIESRIGKSRKVDVLLSKRQGLKKLNLENVKCILVDEAQFLSKKQVEDLWYISKYENIPVICYGLKTNFKSELFEGSKRIIELADEMEELITICSCGHRAKYNARIINGEYVLNGDVVAIDNIDAKYEPLCGKCYIDKVLNKNI